MRNFTNLKISEAQEKEKIKYITNHSVGTAILDRIKWNSKPPSPPLKSRMKPRKSPNARFFYIIDLDGEYKFAIYFVQDCSFTY